MDNSETLIKMLASRITSLRRQSSRLSRMATFSTDNNERRNLREESKSIKNKANMLQARLDKLEADHNAQKDDLISNG